MSLTGITRSCKKRRAGVYQIAIIEAPNVTGATVDPTSPYSYSAIDRETGTKFSLYEFQEDLAEYTESVDENGMVTQSVIFKTQDMNEESQGALQELLDKSACGFVGAVKKPNGEIFVAGYTEEWKGTRPLRYNASTGSTGRALSDETGDEVTLVSSNTEKARMYTGDFDALLVATP